jgi:hypothetical protein
VRSKEGLAYSTGGRYTANIEYPGLFYAYAFTKNQSTGQAIQEMIKEIKSMQTDPPTPMEMSKGKDGYLNSFVFNFDKRSEIVSRMMNYDFYGLPEDLLFKQKDEVEKVTPEDVITAARNDLHPDSMRIVVLGNKDEFDMPLDELGLGTVEQIDITIPSGEEQTEVKITPEGVEKGQQLIDAAVNAHGGLANFRKIKSVSRKGKYTIYTPQGEFSFSIESIEQFPDKNSTVINMMGREVYDIRDGDKGWKTGQDGQIVPKTEEDLKKDQQELERSMIYIFKMSAEPPYQAVYDGDGVIGEIPVEYVVLLDADGQKICRLGFNKTDNTLAYKSYWGDTPLGEGNIEESFDEMKEYDGVLIPTITYGSLNGQPVSKIEITEYKVNPEIPAGTFAKP